MSKAVTDERLRAALNRERQLRADLNKAVSDLQMIRQTAVESTLLRRENQSLRKRIEPLERRIVELEFKRT